MKPPVSPDRRHLFLYVAAEDLVPDVKRTPELGEASLRFAAFVAGLLTLQLARVASPLLGA